MSYLITEKALPYGQNFSVFLPNCPARKSNFLTRVDILATSRRHACAEMLEHPDLPARSSPPSRCACFRGRSLLRWHDALELAPPSCAPPSCGRGGARKNSGGWRATEPRGRGNPWHRRGKTQTSDAVRAAAAGNAEPRGIRSQSP